MSSSGEDSGCEAGLFCEYVTAIKKTVCQAKRELGEMCNGNDRCKSGACGLSGKCVVMNLCAAGP
jgi:hypothetical protein